jgi:hypothetical protein
MKGRGPRLHIGRKAFAGAEDTAIVTGKKRRLTAGGSGRPHRDIGPEKPGQKPPGQRPGEMPVTASAEVPVTAPGAVPGKDTATKDRVSMSPAPETMPAKAVGAKDSARKEMRPPAPVRGAAKKDSSRKQPPAPPAKDDKDNKKEKEHGWMAGIGLNQFFPIGGQQSAYGTDGTTGTLSDYIPVPMIRYYFSHKLYVQLEAQFNTPQATKKNLVISYPPFDSIAGTPTRVQTSANLQQLFYFNLPLSVHYTPFDHVNIGTGLQYSRLTNAIGSFDSSVSNLGSPDTVNTKSIRSFKGDTLYQKIRSAELRWLFDASYTWRHFIFGIRYNQALSKFINAQIVPGQVTQGRNTSLQLYLRYIIWDGRRRRKTSPSK